MQTNKGVFGEPTDKLHNVSKADSVHAGKPDCDVRTQDFRAGLHLEH